MNSFQFKLEGMTCASCASKIEKALIKTSGVQSASVNFAIETARVESDDSLSEESLISIIKTIGYDAHPKESSEIEEGKEADKINRGFQRFMISFNLSIIIFILAMGPGKNWFSPELNRIIQLLLVLPVYLWIGFPFLKAVKAFFLTGNSNMNTLIGLGTSSAFIYSAIITVFNEFSRKYGLNQQVYFEAIGFITSFVNLGFFFEEKAKKKAKEALDSLLKLEAPIATVLKDNVETQVPIEDVKKNNLIRVKPGEKIPVDGLVVEGNSHVDESMMTGEPMPNLKQKDSKVFAGTINGSGVLTFKAKKIGKDTFLAHIVDFVEKAQAKKAPIQRYADKMSSVFVPVIIAIAITTFFSWYFFGPAPVWGNAISSMIAVLVIACPCALGLATPTAVVVATGLASKKGILIGGGDIIEKGSNIDAIVFDKTGTLTHGKPKVVETFPFSDKYNELELLEYAGSAESFSEHPLSKAILDYSKDKKANIQDPSSFSAEIGMGVKATVNDKEVLLGTEDFLKQEKAHREGLKIVPMIGTLVFMAIDKEPVCAFVIQDEIKAEAREYVEKFKALGLETWLISGDCLEVAEDVAKKLGIDHVFAKALPKDKARYIQKIQSLGKKVAMVGDGINDAPALSQADLSMAMGTGTDVAMEASDVTLVGGEIRKAYQFIRLSLTSMKIIKQNFLLSIIYNALLIPLAAGVFYPILGWKFPPVLASVAMGLSSISVVANSIRIKNIAFK